jgi:phosphopantothenoylcysteine decarboxylase / phosphopantothenate---cysteine ligase
MSNSLRGKRIILGVTGSIAAVKAPRVASELKRAGAEVFCVMTESAHEFTSAKELSDASGTETITKIFQKERSISDVRDASGRLGNTWHVELGRSADAMLIAPCSASIIGRLRGAIYDDPVTLVAASLRHTTPLILAPAMDEEMWLQPAVQDALSWLCMHEVSTIGPVKGLLASGLTGLGRLPEPEQIISEFAEIVSPSMSLRGKRVLITGGPTYEPIDAVRFLGNRSSGKMAAALAQAAKRMGANVTLIMGPTAISTNGVAERLDVETAEEMLAAVRAQLPNADIVIMNAAVSDFAPETVIAGKMKKRETGDAPSIPLRKTPDILSEIARSKREGQIVVGFALEKGEGSEAYARGKLEEKKLDMIVLNDIAEEGAGFGTETNKVTIFTRDGKKSTLPLMTKEQCAREILKAIGELG